MRSQSVSVLIVESVRVLRKCRHTSMASGPVFLREAVCVQRVKKTKSVIPKISSRKRNIKNKTHKIIVIEMMMFDLLQASF